jgi:hypothetical protein
MNVFEFIKSWTVVKFGGNRIRFIEAVYLKYLFFIFYTKKKNVSIHFINCGLTIHTK